MNMQENLNSIYRRYLVPGNHGASDYFSSIRELLVLKEQGAAGVQEAIDEIYGLLADEIEHNQGRPRKPISFGTSGWRGYLGKDVFVHSARCVTLAIIDLYRQAEAQPELLKHLGVSSFSDGASRGCLVGWDNRFGGELIGRQVAQMLVQYGFKVYLCGESTTGVLSAALLQLGAAFSVNLTPSHNPLEYGGYKYNAADGGPAAEELTSLITAGSRRHVERNTLSEMPAGKPQGELIEIDSLGLWVRHVENNGLKHRIDYRQLLENVAARSDIDIVVDAVHGASRLHIKRLLGPAASRLELLRGDDDVTFGGIAPEPSSANLAMVTGHLKKSKVRLKIGAIIDPDGDRIRFTDGTTEISMNQFGALAYHFLHEHKGLRGLVAKTVATSNLANAVAEKLGEEVFETRVGFKEFKPVIGKALVCFEESDGISIIGHTPEKDAYIGLLLAIDMVAGRNMNLGELQREMEQIYGVYCPARDGVEVSLQGEELTEALSSLEQYRAGSALRVGGREKRIKEIISIDGRKMIFEDNSWLMIRPSGTEPKVRFYVESRDPGGTGDLVAAAKEMLAEAGLLEN